jgi:Ca2+-binding RTX toxin-like protein
MCILCSAFGSEYASKFHEASWAAAGDLDSGSDLPQRAFANMAGVGSTGNQDIDGILAGVRWTGTVTYSFPDSAQDYPANYGYGEPTAPGFAQVSAAQQQAVHKIMGQLSSLTNVVIQYAGTNGADIRIAQSSEANPTAYAYYPNSTYSEGGDVWFGNSYNYTNPKLGDYYYLTHLHELGHSFGLKHGQDTGGVSNVALPSSHDALEYSVMTYRSYVGGPTNGYTNEAYGYPQSYMMNDILALQTMYGANFNTNSGDTVYTWSPTTGETFLNGVGQGRPGGASAGSSANRVFITIWDGNGNDTYDLSNYTNAATIDLQPGSFSLTSNTQRAYLGNGHYAQGNVYNAYLYNNDSRSYVENAIGGTGNDTLIGNAIGNRLDGGAGNDTLTGGGGDDTFIFRSANGADSIVDFSAGAGTPDEIDLINFSNVTSYAQAMAFASQVGNNTVFNFGSGSTLTLLNVLLSALIGEDFTFSSAPPAPNEAPTEIDLSSASVAENSAGAVVGDLSVIDPDGESFFSFAVSDARFHVVGGPGAYQLALNNGISLDFETEPSVALSVTATDGGGLSVSEAFNLTVVDTLGVDIVGTDAGEKIDSRRSALGQPLPTTDDDTIDGKGGNDKIYALAGNDFVQGGDGNDAIYGDLGNDVIYGGAGGDKIYGDAGNDTLVGGADNDKIFGGEGDDRILIGGATDPIGDKYDGGVGTDTLVIDGSDPVVLSKFTAASASIEIWEGNGAAVLGDAKGNVIDLGYLTSASGIAYIDGDLGNDKLTGTNFADDLRGGDGKDTLNGLAGNDTLIGGALADTLTGGAGADAFVFAETGSTNRDTINDYSFAEGDVIDLAALLDGAVGLGQDIADFVRLATSGSNVTVQVDVDGLTGGSLFLDVAMLKGYATPGVDQVLVEFDQQQLTLLA